MDLPKKITPERLKDTIVEFRYRSDIPFDYLHGLIYEALKPDLEPASNFNTKDVVIDPSNLFVFGHRNDIFENQLLRLQVAEDRLIFNSNGEYQGWNRYWGGIRQVLAHLSPKNWLDHIYWVGLRYVSEFPDVQIFDQLIWKFEYKWGEAASFNTTFRTEWMDQEDRMTVNLVNNAQREGQPFSLMAVDVNHNFTRGVHVGQALEVLERLHRKEKSIFFGIMRPDFLTSLNPSY